MNHKNTTLALAAILAAVAVTGVAFAVPQQASAYGHHHHHNSNSIKVSQDISQANLCTNSSFCLNSGSNDADIHR
jgi:archaellin